MSSSDDLTSRVAAIVKRARQRSMGARMRRAHREHVVRELNKHWPA
jgi:hypothetical protein